jgi:protocatechuate 3,4-dioxygenase beta subunit
VIILALVVFAASSALDLATPQEPGTSLHVVGVVEDRAGRPVAGATLHVYQTDASGRYTPDRPMAESNARLSGRLTTDGRGRFEIRTVRPGGYPKPVALGGQDRHIPAHIHIDITAAGHPERRVQLVFADDPLLADPYWKDWVVKLRQPVAATAPEGHGQTAHIELTID